MTVTRHDVETRWSTQSPNATADTISETTSTWDTALSSESWTQDNTTDHSGITVHMPMPETTKWRYLSLVSLPLLSLVVQALLIRRTAAVCGRIHHPHYRAILVLSCMVIIDMLYALAIMTTNLTQTMIGSRTWPWSWCGALLYGESLLNAATMCHLSAAVWDGLYALLKPIRYQLRSTCTHITVTVTSAWVTAVIVTTPLLVLIILCPHHTSPDVVSSSSSSSCKYISANQAWLRILCVYLIPLILVIIPSACVIRACAQQLQDALQMRLDGVSIHANGMALSSRDTSVHSQHTIALTVEICQKVAELGRNGHVGNGHVHSPVETDGSHDGEQEEEGTMKAMETLTNTELLHSDNEEASLPDQSPDDKSTKYSQCNGHCGSGDVTGGKQETLVSVDVNEQALCPPTTDTVNSNVSRDSSSPQTVLVQPQYDVTASREAGARTSENQKKTRKDLNGPVIDIANIEVLVTDTSSITPSTDEHVTMTSEDFSLYDTEDETPLATSIRVKDDNDKNNERMLDSDTSDLSSSASPEPFSKAPRRSILRRDGSTRNTVRKNVKFSNTVSTKEIKAVEQPSPSKKRGIKRQSSLHQPHRVNYVRQDAIQIDNGDVDPMRESGTSVLSELRLSQTSDRSRAYLSKLHHWQGQRIVQRVQRQRAHLRLISGQVCMFSLLTLPHLLLSLVVSLEQSVSDSVILAIHWLTHSAHVINPLIFLLCSALWTPDTTTHAISS